VHLLYQKIEKKQAEYEKYFFKISNLQAVFKEIYFFKALDKFWALFQNFELINLKVVE